MAARDSIEAWFTHTVGVERYSGAGVSGPVFEASVDLSAFVDPVTKQVRAATGETSLSFAGVFLPHDTAAVPVGSRVTLPSALGGAVGTVLSCAPHASGLGTPDHLELRLG